MSGKAWNNQSALFDEHLVEGERIITFTEKIFDPEEGSILAISTERLLFLDKKDFFHDIKYGHIVSLGRKYTFLYANTYLFTLLAGLICLFFGQVLYQEVIIIDIIERRN